MLTDVWATFREYEHVHKHHEAYVTDLTLNPGRMYRFAVKFCAITTCYAPLYSDGVLILAHPPTKGQITVEHRNSSQSNSLKETVILWPCISTKSSFIFLDSVLKLRDHLNMSICWTSQHIYDFDRFPWLWMSFTIQIYKIRRRNTVLLISTNGPSRTSLMLAGPTPSGTKSSTHRSLKTK